MDRLTSMSLFIAAVDAGSLSAAARRRNIPLATLSRRISDLEAHLRTSLFTRGSRRLTLTDAGRDYLAACRRVLEEVEAAERIAAGEYTMPRGELVVTAPVVFGRLHLMPITAELLRTYPDISLRVMLADRMVNLVEEHVDVAVRIGHLPDSSLMATRVGSIRRVVCASPAYLAARGIPADPGELAAHDIVAFEPSGQAQPWSFRASGQDLSVPLRPRLVVNTAEAAIDAAKAGLGITRVLSYQVAQALQEGLLTLVLEAHEAAPMPVSLVHAGGPRLALKLRAFLDVAAPALRAALAEPR